MNRVVLLGSLVFLAATQGLVRADCSCGYEHQPSADCASVATGCGTVAKTIMVPSWVTDTKMVTCTEYRPEKRERKVTTYKMVPEQKEVTRKCIVMTPEQHTRTVNYTVCVPTTRKVTKQYKVQVPYWKEVTHLGY